MEKYQELIGNDHHKEKDRHFTIKQHFTAGEGWEWVVVHRGYLHDWEIKAANYDRACFLLKKKLQDMIHDVKKWQANDNGLGGGTDLES